VHLSVWSVVQAAAGGRVALHVSIQPRPPCDHEAPGAAAGDATEISGYRRPEIKWAAGLKLVCLHRVPRLDK